MTSTMSISTCTESNSLYAHAGSYFVLAMLDKLWHPNLTEAEALDLHVKGIDEVKNRLVVAPPDFIIKVTG